MKISHYMAGAAAMALLALGPGAMAQQGSTSGQPGSTSGPAAGSPVQPSTAVQKQTPGAAPQGMTGAQAQQGGVGAGAPGVTAKPGTEGGPAPRPDQSAATAERESMPGMGQDGMGMMGSRMGEQHGDMGMMQGAGADDWGWRGQGGWEPGGWGHWRGDGGWDHGGWGWGHGGWRGGEGWQDHGWRGRRRGHHAAHFMFRSPQGNLTVKCSEDEPMRACVEAATTLLDRVQSMRQVTPGQTQPGPSGPPPTGRGIPRGE